MNIQEAITKVDALKPNDYQQPQKIDWLSSVDGRFFNEVIKPRDPEAEWEPYGPETDTSMTLLIPEPYSDVYIYYMAMMIDYWNGEYTRYNNSLLQFNTSFKEYANKYSKEFRANGASVFLL